MRGFLLPYSGLPRVYSRGDTRKSGNKYAGMAAIALPTALALAVPAYAMAQDVSSAPSQNAAPAILHAGTRVAVVMESELSTTTSNVGDVFQVTVAEDVGEQGIVVIPKGTHGRGIVTFATKRGGFGKPGILGISLQSLELNGKNFLLDGRYREEGKDRDGAAGATMFAVGIFAGLVKGASSAIPKGRRLSAHTGEDIPFPTSSASPAAVDLPSAQATAPEASSAKPQSDPNGAKAGNPS